MALFSVSGFLCGILCNEFGLSILTMIGGMEIGEVGGGWG